MSYGQLDRFFIRYFNSKPIQGRLNGKSLAFVIGSQNGGKTQYIQKNIQIIKNKKNMFNNKINSINNKYPQFDINKSPQSLQDQILQQVFDNQFYIIIDINYKQIQGVLNFKGFIQNLHQTIFHQIIKLLNTFQQKQTKHITITNNKDKQNHHKYLLSSNIIKNIITHQYAPQYLFIYIKDVIYCMLQDKDQIFIKNKQKLQQFNDQILGKSYQTFFELYYDRLIDILNEQIQQIDNKNNQQIKKIYTTLKLFYSVFSRIQYQYRPKQYINSFYQSGIQTTNFLFDILNFLSGTGKYLQSIQKSYVSLQTTNQQKQTIKKLVQSSENYILNGNHIDIMLSLSNLEQLLCFQNRNQQFLDFFDHIICRTVNSSNFRKHFPIIIQIPNRQFLDQTLQLGKIAGSNPIIVQIPGYILTLLRFSNIAQIFDIKFLQKHLSIIGRNTHTWKNIIQFMAKGQRLKQLINAKSEFQKKQIVIAQAKMNRVYTQMSVISYLNSGQLDFYMMQSLKLFNEIKGMGRTQHQFYSDLLFKLPHFQMLFKHNILYHHYYMPYFQYQNVPIYLQTYKKYLQKIRSLYLVPSLSYKIWQWKTRPYSIIPRQIEYREKDQKIYHEHCSFGKNHIDQQFWQTYYGPLYTYGYDYKRRAYEMSAYW